MSFTVVSITISYIDRAKLWKASANEPRTQHAGSRHYLAAFVDEYQLYGVVCIPGDRGDLAGYPAELLVGKPDPGALAVYVFGHGVERGAGKERGSGRNKSSAVSRGRCPPVR